MTTCARSKVYAIMCVQVCDWRERSISQTYLRNWDRIQWRHEFNMRQSLKMEQKAAGFFLQRNKKSNNIEFQIISNIQSNICIYICFYCLYFRWHFKKNLLTFFYHSTIFAYNSICIF